MNLTPRHAAVKLLLEVLYQNGFSNYIFESLVTENAAKNASEKSSWNSRDRAFLKNLSFGVLRRLYVLDALLEEKCSGPFQKLPDAIKVVMRAGLYQLAFMDRVPSHAAVSESVKLAKKYGHGGTVKLVNAVLRRLADEKGGLKSKVESFSSNVSLYTSHPEWLAQRYIKEYGAEGAQKILDSNNDEPPPNFRVVKKKRLEEAALEASVKIEKNRFCDTGVEVTGPSEAVQKLIAENAIVPQDQSSIIATSFLSSAAGRVLELCCGRGTKSGALVEHIGGQSVLVNSDISHGKLKRLNAVSKRFNPVCCDMLTPLPFGKKFDFIFIDAPCSNLGAVRRHPEIRYRKSQQDISAMAGVQLAALNNAAGHAADSAKILYAVCSIEAEETTGVAQRFLAKRADFSAVDIGKLRPDLKEAGLTDGEFLKIPTGKYGMDGFFAAVFENTGEKTGENNGKMP